MRSCVHPKGGLKQAGHANGVASWFIARACVSRLLSDVFDKEADQHDSYAKLRWDRAAGRPGFRL
jgi:hypothetical protein